MKKIFRCLAVLLICRAVLAESKTEVVVKEGIVKTTTPQGDSLVRPVRLPFLAQIGPQDTQ